LIKVPFPAFVLSKHPTFWDRQKEYETQKAAGVKEPRKKEKKRARKRFGSRNGQKKSKFWLMSMPQIKIFHIIFFPSGFSISL